MTKAKNRYNYELSYNLFIERKLFIHEENSLNIWA